MGTDTKFNLRACQNMGTDTESGLVTARMGTDTKFNLRACQNMGTDTESGLVTARYGDRHEVQPHLPRVATRSPKAAGRGGAGGTPSL